MTQRFADLVTIVTGTCCVASGWGNGRATAVGLATEGAKVSAVDRQKGGNERRARDRPLLYPFPDTG